jgi:hypothetical protein
MRLETIYVRFMVIIVNNIISYRNNITYVRENLGNN